jgi:hypothetical protein
MVWFATLYISFLIWIGWRSVRSSVQEHGAAATSLEIATSIAWPLLVAAYFWPSLAAWLGRAALPIFLLAAAWTAFTWCRDFRPSVAKADLPEDHRVLVYLRSSALGAAIVIPVVVLGALVVRSTW